MAVDIVDLPMTTNDDTRGAQNTATNQGTDNVETIDDDLDTYYGIQSYHNGDGDTNCFAQSEHTWPIGVHIQSLFAKGRMEYTAGNYFDGDMDVEISLKIDGVWTKIVDDHWDDDPSGSNTWGVRNFEYNEDNDSEGWDNVTGFRVYVYCYAYSYEGNRVQYTRAYINEVEALYEPEDYAVII